MSSFTLKQEGFSEYTTISNCFIEQYMPYAAGEFVKIYIYLLKCVGERQSELSVSKIADVFNNTEKDVVRALKYWQKKGLLKLTFNEENVLTSLNIIPATEAFNNAGQETSEGKSFGIVDAPVPGQTDPKKQAARKAQFEENKKQQIEATERKTETPNEEISLVPAKREYSKEEIDSFSENEDIIQTKFFAEKYLGTTLTSKDMDTVFYIYDSLHFPEDLIDYLFQYCVSMNHRNMRYIEKTAINWAEKGIKTVNAAKTMAGIYSGDCYDVMRAFGLSGRKPTKTETEYVSRWTLSYGFDINIVVEACSRTMNQLHQPSFEYTDAILQSWRAKGVMNMEDIQKSDAAFEEAAQKKASRSKKAAVACGAAKKTKFNNFQQRSYDYEALERQLFNR